MATIIQKVEALGLKPFTEEKFTAFIDQVVKEYEEGHNVKGLNHDGVRKQLTDLYAQYEYYAPAETGDEFGKGSMVYSEEYLSETSLNELLARHHKHKETFAS